MQLETRRSGKTWQNSRDPGNKSLQHRLATQRIDQRCAKRRRATNFLVLFGLGLIGSHIALAQSVIQGTTWFPIGPAYVANGQGQSGSVNTSGRTSAIAVNPANPSELWVGTSSGGVWHSTNGGANFTPISDNVASLAIGAIALDNCTSTGCGVIYAGTGENSIRRDTYYGMGLLIGQVSGGEISQFGWTAVGTDVFNYANINAVILDPTTTAPNKVIYVALSSGVTSSASETIVTAPTPPQGYGVFKSTNQGSSWTLLNVPGATAAKATDLVMDPTDNKTLYAGFFGRGVFKTADAGATWCPLNAGIALPSGCTAATGLPNPSSTTFDSVRIAIRRPTAANPATLYVILGNCPDPIGNAAVFGGYCTPPIYKSSDGGNSWTQVNAGASAGVSSSNGETRGFSRYHQALTISPNDPATLYHGGLVLAVSTDSGASFNNVGDDYLHPDHHSLVFPDPNNLNRMYDVSDGGFASSNDGGATWDTTGNFDLQTTGFQSMSWSPLTPAVIGGSQDNGTEIWVGTRIWQHADDGDAGFTVMDLDNVLNMYDTYVFSDPRESTDGGSCCFWASITTGLPQFFPIVEPVAEYAPMIQASTPPHNMYFGTNRLYESTNKGGTWTPVSPALGGTSQFFPDIGTNNVITAIAVAPNNANRVYVGYYDGEIFFSNGACASASCWTSISNNLPSAPVTRIGVDPNNADTVYATFSGFGGGAHLFKSTNVGSFLGTSWTGLTNGLPAIPTNTITVENSQVLWVGADNGVYQSLNSGASFVRYGIGLPNVPVYEIALDTQRGRLWAGTHGRGVFLLTQPFLSNFEGWVNNDIWDIPVYGNGFVSSLSTPAGSACSMQLIQQNGAVCASSTTDAMGGTISFDNNGELVTSKSTFYNGKEVAWGCFNGSCIGGKTIAQCNPSNNPITSVTVTCGSQVGIDHIVGCPAQANPPTSVLGLSAMPGGAGGGGGAVTPVAPAAPRALGAGAVGAISFDVVPTVQARTGVRVLCTASVSTSANDTPASALVKARDSINITPACQQASVQAVVHGIPPDPPLNEDLQRSPAHLSIRAPNVVGGQLFTVVHAPAGAATGACFDISGLGSPLLKQVAVMKVDFETSGGGAAGGNITVQERSSLGACTTSLRTTAGQSGNDIATSLANAFQASGVPGPAQCPAMQNPRDVTADGTSLVTVVASGLRVCNSDPNVGLVVGPKELPNLRHRVLQYAAKFLCGETGEHKDYWDKRRRREEWPQVADGRYHTAINLHNPTDKATAVGFKFAVALPDGKPGPISSVTEIALGPDQAVSIDCAKIFETLHREHDFIDGFVVVESDVELDVVAVYTSGGEHGHLVMVHTERVPARLVQQ